jgi:hypothetical protein
MKRIKKTIKNTFILFTIIVLTCGLSLIDKYSVIEPELIRNHNGQLLV